MPTHNSIDHNAGSTRHRIEESHPLTLLTPLESRSTSQPLLNETRSIPTTEPSNNDQTHHDGSTETLLKAKPEPIPAASHAASGQKLPILHPNTWLWEILALSVCIVTLVVLTVLLGVYDGKPSPVVGGITVNMVISFTSTVFRISLMVPIASCISQLTWTWFA